MLTYRVLPQRDILNTMLNGETGSKICQLKRNKIVNIIQLVFDCLRWINKLSSLGSQRIEDGGVIKYEVSSFDTDDLQLMRFLRQITIRVADIADARTTTPIGSAKLSAFWNSSRTE